MKYVDQHVEDTNTMQLGTCDGPNPMDKCRVLVVTFVWNAGVCTVPSLAEVPYSNHKLSGHGQIGK
jgi:hypothetical protein